MERKLWLEEAIEDYIKNNPNRDSVDIVFHFKLNADIIFESIQRLIENNKVVRVHIFGARYAYMHLSIYKQYKLNHNKNK